MTVPDIGDTFETRRPYRVRRWRALPWPKVTHYDVHRYRVDGWLKRRPPREPYTGPDERERMVDEIIRELMAKGEIDPPRGHGPDRVPLMFCRREDAEYVSGYGVSGTIQRVADVVIDGRVSWSEETLAEERRHAELLAGEPLI